MIMSFLPELINKHGYMKGKTHSEEVMATDRNIPGRIIPEIYKIF